MRGLLVLDHRDKRGRRLVRRNPSLQARDGKEPSISAIVEKIGIHLARVSATRRTHDTLHHHRHKEVAYHRLLDAMELRREYADHRKAMAVHHQPFADDAAIAVEASLPERVTEHDDRMISRRHVVSRANQSPNGGANAE